MAATAPSVDVGTLVQHVTRPEWGPGKVLDVSGATVTVYFRDYTETKAGDALKKISRNYLRIAEVQIDPWLDNIPPLRNGSLGLAKTRLTVEQAVTFFRHRFPLGFTDPAYAEEERTYKVRHRDLYQELFGNGIGPKLLQMDSIDELVRRA